ncbi:hypothetical protein [Streptomyces olindensis]|uniref:hypothetical protein n=1 Tax=Streptomyces olindensis TaxID=358823 RepID=UPI003652068C
MATNGITVRIPLLSGDQAEIVADVPPAERGEPERHPASAINRRMRRMSVLLIRRLAAASPWMRPMMPGPDQLRLSRRSGAWDVPAWMRPWPD